MAADDDDIEVRVILRDELSEPSRRVEERIDALGDSAEDTAQDVDGLSDSMDENTDAMNRNERSARAHAQARDDMGRFIRGNSVDIDKDTTVLKRNTRQRKSSTKAVFSMSKSFSKLTKMSMPLLKVGTALSAVGHGATALSALGAGATAAVSGLAPLTGALLPLPGLMAGAIQGGVATKLAFGGIGEALKAVSEGDPKKIAEATKNMGPYTLDAVRAMAKLNKEWKPIKTMVQEKVWDQISDRVEGLGKTYLPILRKTLGDTADEMNLVLRNTLDWLNSAEASSKITRIMNNNTKMVAQFGRAGQASLRGTVGLLDATGETGIRMATDIANALERLADLIDKNRDKIGAFADRGYSLLKKVGGVLGDLFVGLYNIGKLSMGLAGDMGGGIETMAEKFKDWTASAEGQRRITKFFDDARPVLVAIKDLVVALAKAFGEISTQSGTAPMIDKLTSLVPTLVDLVNSSSTFLPNLLDIAGALIEVAAGADLLTPGALLLQIVAPILETIADLFTSLPQPVQTAIGWIAMFGFVLHSAATGGAFAFLMGIGPINKAITILVGNLKVLMFVLRGMAASFLSFLFTNPIGWIILGVIALIALFVVLWKKSETFRNIIKSIGDWFVKVWNTVLFPLIMKVWDWMKSVWDKVYAFIKGVITAVVDWFKRNWDTIKTVALVVVTAIIMYFKAWWKVISTYVKIWIGIFKIAFTIIKNVVLTVIRVVMAIWKAAWWYIQNIVWPVISTIITIIKGIASVVWAVIKLVIAIFKMGFQIVRLVVNVVIWAIIQAFNFMKPIVMAVIGFIVGMFKTGWSIISTVVRIAVGIIMAIVNFLKPFIMMIINNVVMIFRTGWMIVSTVVRIAIGIISGIIRFIVGFIMGIINTVVSIWTTGWGIVSGIVGGAIDFIRGIIDGVMGFIQPVLDRIQGAWDATFGWVRDFVMGIIDRIRGGIEAITGIVEGITSGIGKVADMLPGFFAGGQVQVGLKATVGELGPEAFVSNSGKVSMVGMNGPEVRRFPQSGYIVPNHVLAGQHDSSVPGHVMKRLHASQSAGQDRMGTPERRSRAESHDGYMESDGGANVQVIVQPGAVANAAEIKAAVKEALREAERSRKERG